MMTCSSCGTSVPGTATFCMGCGQALRQPPGGTLAPAMPGGAVALNAPAQQTTPTLAIVGLVLSLIPCGLINIAGLVCGAIALGEIKRRPHELKGRGLALAAVIIGSVWLFIGVLGMLAAIAIPNFIKFQARSKQAEAKVTLKTLSAGMASAKAQLGEVPTTFEGVGWVPQGQLRYAYFLGEDERQPELGGPYGLPDALPEDAVAVAVGNIDSDETLDVWVLDSAGQVSNLVNDVQE